MEETCGRIPQSLLRHTSQRRQTLITISAEVIRPAPPLHAKLACNGEAKRNENAVCHGETGLETYLLIRAMQRHALQGTHNDKKHDLGGRGQRVNRKEHKKRT